MAAVGAVLSDARRCRMLAALGDGRALAATVLAMEAGVAPSTASEHLARLTEGRFVTVEQRGRNRYYRLAGPDVAQLLELIARMAPPAPVRSLREGTRAEALRKARTCYDHLAGRLGVAIMDRFLERCMIEAQESCVSAGSDHTRASDTGYVLTETGRETLADLGVKVESTGRRPLVRTCLDWSEQRPHLAGALGAVLAQRFFELRWIARAPRSRAVLVTSEGKASLWHTFSITLDATA